MKSCDLCKSSSAKMYCQSDQASLCWDCDAKVHSANFLVTRHSRSLLCKVCQSPTPWNASGAKLGRTVSLCEICVDHCERVENGTSDNEERDEGYGDEIDSEDEDYDEEDDEYDEEDEEIGGNDEDGDNQIVPWSPTPPPPDATSSSSEETSSGFRNGGRAAWLMQLGENVADLYSGNDDPVCSSAHRENISPLAPSYKETPDVESLRPLKRQRTEPIGTRYPAVVETIVEMSNRGDIGYE